MWLGNTCSHLVVVVTGNCYSIGLTTVLNAAVAVAAGRQLAIRVFGGDPTARLEYENIPTVVFSHPPIGTVGMTQGLVLFKQVWWPCLDAVLWSEEAIAKYGKDKLKIYYEPTQSMYFSVIERKERTVLKLICLLPDEKVFLVSLHFCMLWWTFAVRLLGCIFWAKVVMRCCKDFLLLSEWELPRKTLIELWPFIQPLGKN